MALQIYQLGVLVSSLTLFDRPLLSTFGLHFFLLLFDALEFVLLEEEVEVVAILVGNWMGARVPLELRGSVSAVILDF